MRLRVGISCATITCAGAAMATAASCVSSQNPAGPGGIDASFNEASAVDTGSVQPSEDAGADVGTPDSAVDAPVDAGCSPRGGFQPPPYVSAPPGTDFPCIGSPLKSAFVADCLEDASTYSTCSGFADAGIDGGSNAGACSSCLFSPENTDAGYYGPVIEGVVPVLNVAGCLQITDLSDAGYDCAVALQAAWQCAEYACMASCPVSDDPSRAAYLACTQLAATGVCSTYTQAANACVAAELEGGPPYVMACFDGADDAGEALSVLDYFCGT